MNPLSARMALFRLIFAASCLAAVAACSAGPDGLLERESIIQDDRQEQGTFYLGQTGQLESVVLINSQTV